MVGVQQVIYLWKEWGVQVLMLLSFTLQVELQILAELRRNMDSGLLRIFAWSAYQLADTTAIFVLGHLTVISRSPDHDELMALWAPFLLLHLGGQDNITAYAIEDNQLWLRHLQTFATQVTAASYVLYESSIFSSRSLLRPVATLMLVVGVARYGERVWVLRCAAGSAPSGRNYIYYGRRSRFRRLTVPSSWHWWGPWEWGVKELLLIAHLSLDVSKDFLKGPIPSVRAYEEPKLVGGWLYMMAERHLSLMHDVFYTKAEVMHTWYGICFRIIWTLCTTIAYLLFRQFDHKVGYSKVDVTVTHVLFIGAIILEALSLLRAMFSSWTLIGLVKMNLRPARGRVIWSAVSGVIMFIRHLGCSALRRGRNWSDSMGQHNLLQLCAHRRASLSSKIARWMGVEDLWNTLAYPWSIRVSSWMEDLLVDRVLEWRRKEKLEKLSPEALDNMINSWGEAVLKEHGLHEELAWAIGVPLEEGILIWHLATNIYLCWYREQWNRVEVSMDSYDFEQRDQGDRAEELSNYMLFLLAARPYMLPPSTGRKAYVEMCYGLTGLGCRTVKEIASKLRGYGDTLNKGLPIKFTYTTIDIKIDDPLRHNKTLDKGIKLGSKLIGHPVFNPIMLAHVWAEMLCYAGYRCSAYSHAKQLSNGGELITIAALLVKYITFDINHQILSDDN